VLECLTGTRCYPGTVVETAMARLHRAPIVPVELPIWLRHTLRAMTARNTGQRPPAAAVADAFRRRSLDAVRASTADVDVAALSTDAPPAMATHDITGSSDTTKNRQIPRPPPNVGEGRRPLALAFSSGALTTAAALAILALFLAIWPFEASGVPMTESQTPSIPTSTTIERGPTASVPIQATVKQTPTTQPTPPPAADLHGADDDAAPNDNSGHGNGRGRGNGKANRG
jgi:hypothetical protein